jgi:Ctr copper transporter family
MRFQPAASRCGSPQCYPCADLLPEHSQAGTHVTLWLRSWHTHTRVQYAFSFLLLAALAAAAEALSALRARCLRFVLALRSASCRLGEPAGTGTSAALAELLCLRAAAPW